MPGGFSDQGGDHPGSVAYLGADVSIRHFSRRHRSDPGRRIAGDLIVQGGGDPFFVTEDALALRQSLQELGLKRVTGKLIISGNFS